MNNLEEDDDLPDFIPISIYQESFGGLKDVTEEWYQKNDPVAWDKYKNQQKSC